MLVPRAAGQVPGAEAVRSVWWRRRWQAGAGRADGL